MNIPNTLTLLRIALIPVFVLSFYLPYPWSIYSATCIFIIASFTDFLDGYLARALNQSTPFGAFLDPVADKLMVCIALTLIASHAQSPLITLAVVIIIAREITISGLREWMAQLGASSNVSVSSIGKYKTAFQMIAITSLLLASLSPVINYLGLTMLYLSAILTLWSMFQYFKNAWPLLLKSASSPIPNKA